MQMMVTCPDRMQYDENYYRKRYEALFDQVTYQIYAAIEHVRRFGDLGISGKVLEFGCGLGQNIYPFQDRVGFDPGGFARDFCREKGIPVIASLEEAKPASFDYVILSHVLEHVTRPFEVLRAIPPLLTRGGRLIVFLPKERQIRSYRTPDADLWDHHLFAWNFHTMNNLLSEAGFKPIENRYIRFVEGYRRGHSLFVKSPRVFLFLGSCSFWLRHLFFPTPLRQFSELRIVAEVTSEKEK